EDGVVGRPGDRRLDRAPRLGGPLAEFVAHEDVAFWPAPRPDESLVHGGDVSASRRVDSYPQSVKRRQKKRKHARRVQHAQATRTPDRPTLMISAADCPTVDNGHIV